MLQNVVSDQSLQFATHPAFLYTLISSVVYSELTAVFGRQRRPKACVRKFYGTAYVSLPSNQTGNKHFVCSLSSFQLMWQIYLCLLRPNGKIRYRNPVPKFEWYSFGLTESPIFVILCVLHFPKAILFYFYFTHFA